MNILQMNTKIDGLIDQFVLNISSTDKVGLIGLNGVGKTTLVKEMIRTCNNKSVIISYLTQHDDYEDENILVIDELRKKYKEIYELFKLVNDKNLSEKKHVQIQEELVNKDAYNIDSKIDVVIQGMNLSSILNQKLNTLSGGQKIRVRLAKMLLDEPDLLILDEPTNHLDIVTIEWLEGYLKKWNKAFIVISHDREFLDNICNKIVEIENKKLHEYSGSFDDFIIQKEMITKGLIKRYKKEQEYIKKIQEYIARFKEGIKSKQARGRQKLLDRFEAIDNPIFNPKRMKLKFEIEKQTSDLVLKIENLSYLHILKNISFNLYKGDKVAIIGKNGIGKSTLLKEILKQEINAKVAYFSQDLIDLNVERTVLEEVNEDLSKDESYYKSLLSSFLFFENDYDKKVKFLSGGEKVRLALLKIAQKKPNFLILDEPTNHLDIYSIEILEQALKNYEGTILLVSHNRHFIDEVCNKILILSDKLEEFSGNYEEYKKSIKDVKIINKKEESQNKINYEQQKKKQKLERQISNIENKIDEIQANINELKEFMFDKSISNNAYELQKIQEKIQNLEDKQIMLLDEWERLNDEYAR